jgi:hypothetical protein
MKKKIKSLIRPIWTSVISYKIRGLIFNVSEKILGYSSLKKNFKKRTGYELDLKDPKSFNQKISWKKVYDRNPILPIVADKYKVREYLENVLGAEESKKILIPLLYNTDNPESIPFDNLPDEYIIKANHGSGTNIIVEKGAHIDRQKIIDHCKNWLRQPYGLFKHEWAYQQIDRKIVIEKLLRDSNGELPKDYKFHMMHGECVMVQVNEGHFADKDNRKLTLFSKDWSKHNIYWEFPPADDVECPKNFDSMLLLAEKLSTPFDYVRVDLYSLEDGRIFFGEFTNYPTSGHADVKPISFDYDIGSKWEISTNYWVN